jgi:hypothetical protein
VTDGPRGYIQLDVLLACDQFASLATRCNDCGISRKTRDTMRAISLTGCNVASSPTISSRCRGSATALRKFALRNRAEHSGLFTWRDLSRLFTCSTVFRERLKGRQSEIWTLRGFGSSSWMEGAVSLPEGDGSGKRAREIADGVDRFRLGDDVERVLTSEEGTWGSITSGSRDWTEGV